MAQPFGLKRARKTPSLNCLPTACGKALSAAPKASQVGREESFEAPGWMRRGAKRARRRIRIQRSIYEEARDVARALAKTEAES